MHRQQNLASLSKSPIRSLRSFERINYKNYILLSQFHLPIFRILIRRPMRILKIGKCNVHNQRSPADNTVDVNIVIRVWDICASFGAIPPKPSDWKLSHMIFFYLQVQILYSISLNSRTICTI